MIRSPGPSRVVASVTALSVLSAAALPLYESGTVGPSALLIPVGLLLVVSWLIRMAQWIAAAGAPPQPGELALHLAQGASPAERGRAGRDRAGRGAGGAGRPGGVDAASRGFAVWAVLTDRRGRRAYQRVVWEPWLRDLTGPQRVLVRRRAGVVVLDVEGRGRLWPASFALRRPPWGVRLLPAGGRAGTDLSWWRLLIVLLPVAALCAGPHLAEGDVPAALWAAGYVTALTFGVGQWFGVIPPGRRRTGPAPDPGGAKPPRQRSGGVRQPQQQRRADGRRR
ncbi:hypothetical protein [Catellatospora sp. NPDC049609]|uniref:hypothetical protein n=1 Tax=Catellatospora sp. NPDC049609 TaxID=3155505 RepID=UPI00343EF23C